MPLPDIDGFQHRDVPSGRVYSIDAHTELALFHVETPFPHAPAGFFVYVFVRDRSTVGRWDWTADADAIARIARLYRETTSRDYEPAARLAPGGELAQIRPPLQNLVARAMEDARPGPGLFRRFIEDLRITTPRDGES